MNPKDQMSQSYEEKIEAAAEKSSKNAIWRVEFKQGVQWARKNPPPEWVSKEKYDKLVEAMGLLRNIMKP